MRFSIQRESILKLLRAVSGVVEKKGTQLSPILSHVLMVVEGNSIVFTTTDQEVELRANAMLDESADAGRVTVSFRKLMDICRALPEGETLTLKLEGDRMLIRGGKSRFVLATLPASDFPSLKDEISHLKIQLPSLRLKHLIESTCFAMAEQDVRYYLNGMLLEVKQGILYSIAADGHRLALHSVPVPGVDATLRIILPRKGVLELQRILDEESIDVTLMIGTNHMRISTESVTMTSKLLDGRFPDYERIIPRSGDKVMQVARESLKNAFYRAAALFTDKSRGVQLRMTKGCLKILATNSEQDEVEEDVEVDYVGPELEVGFNIRYLIDFLNVIPTEFVNFTFIDANSSARVEGVGGVTGTYVLMPMRM